MNHDELYETPPAVIGSISLGVGPTPFLTAYALIFLAHGLIYPVQPPDITGSRAGEAVAGFVALAGIIVAAVSIFWFLECRRRWPFVIVQLLTLATSIDFMVDKTTGSALVPAVLAFTSLIALILAFHPDSWVHVGRTPPKWLGGTARGTGDGPAEIPPVDEEQAGPLVFASSAAAPAGTDRQRYVGRRRASGTSLD